MVISCAVSIYSAILNDVVPDSGRVSTCLTTNAVLYIHIYGIATPTIMFLVVLRSYRRYKQNRQRVVDVFMTLFDSLKMIIVSF
jgi:hypothetical protein